MKRFFNFFFLSLFICTGAQEGALVHPPVKAILNQMPKEDYVALDRLFRHLVFESYFAYTLFGSKPMTHRGAFLDVLEREVDQNNGDFIFLTDWHIWKKYANHPEFKTPNFVFVENTLQNPTLFEVHFLNRKNVISCVQKHLKAFQEVLGNDVTPEGIYEKMVGAGDLFEALGESQVLYGILFGFGEKNSRGFYEKFFLDAPLPEPISFHDEEPKPDRLTLPYFKTFSEKERRELKNVYQSERRHILSLYAKGNFLEITLTRLMSPN